MGERNVLARPIQRLRDHHHRLAFLLASGKRPGEAAELTGLSMQWITNLRSDPKFQELLQVYRERCDDIEFDAFKQVTMTRAAVEQLALEEIRDRLQENAEKLSIRDLHDLQADAADRLGRSKVSRNERVSMNIDLADSLAEARRRELRLSASPEPPERDAGLHRANGAEGVDSSSAEGPPPIGTNGKEDPNV